jgi:hypothetical protein
MRGSIIKRYEGSYSLVAQHRHAAHQHSPAARVRLSELRIALKALDALKIQEFKAAQIVGLAPSTLNAWKHGRVLPRRDDSRLARLAALLGRTIDELIGGSNAPAR